MNRDKIYPLKKYPLKNLPLVLYFLFPMTMLNGIMGHKHFYTVLPVAMFWLIVGLILLRTKPILYMMRRSVNRRKKGFHGALSYLIMTNLFAVLIFVLAFISLLPFGFIEKGKWLFELLTDSILLICCISFMALGGIMASSGRSAAHRPHAKR